MTIAGFIIYTAMILAVSHNIYCYERVIVVDVCHNIYDYFYYDETVIIRD